MTTWDASRPAVHAPAARADALSAADRPMAAPRRAPQLFLALITAIHRLIPGVLRRRIPVTFIGYAIINGSGFFIDIGLLTLFYSRLHWYYPVAVTMGYAIAGAYSLLLNRWLNFQSHGHLATQGSRYTVGLVSQYVIFILGLSSLLHQLGVGAAPARVLSACCEGVYLYVLMRLWVFRGTKEPTAVTTAPASSQSARRAR